MNNKFLHKDGTHKTSYKIIREWEDLDKQIDPWCDISNEWPLPIIIENIPIGRWREDRIKTLSVIWCVAPESKTQLESDASYTNIVIREVVMKSIV